MIVRRMTLEDIPRVVQIEEECFSVPWSKKGFEDSLKRTDTVFLVCEEEQVIGYIGMYLSFEEGEITNVAVGCAHRNRGCATRLLCAAKEEAKAHNVEMLVLEVRVSNAPARLLYQNQGFEEIGIRRNFYEHPCEDAIIMKVGI